MLKYLEYKQDIKTLSPIASFLQYFQIHMDTPKLFPTQTFGTNCFSFLFKSRYPLLSGNLFHIIKIKKDNQNIITSDTYFLDYIT